MFFLLLERRLHLEVHLEDRRFNVAPVYSGIVIQARLTGGITAPVQLGHTDTDTPSPPERCTMRGKECYPP